MRQSTQSKDYIFDGHARIQKILSEGTYLNGPSLDDGGIEDPNTTPAKRHFNGASLACCWCPNIEYWFSGDLDKNC